ncbi:MAG: site-specific integrase [Terriglobia bacterium]|jgi:site-specific recombinase XerD
MERFFSDPKALRRMRSGPLKEYIDLFAQQLCDLNYTRICGRILLRRIAQFSRWLKHRRIALQEITPEQVARYLEHHGEVKHGDVTNLNRLLAWLRQKGTIRETLAPIMNTPAKQLEDKFTLYLQQERGLASQTIEYYRRFTRRFLVQRFGDGRLALSELRPEDVVNFVRQQAAFQPKRARLMTTALRSFLAYMRYRGEITTDLSAAVPAVANWSMSSIAST